MIRPRHKPLPKGVYHSFVRSLYENRATLLIGMISHAVTFLLVYTRVNDPFFLIATFAVIAIFLVRMVDMRGFDRIDLSGADDVTLRLWEDRYLLGGLCVTMTCGVACAYAVVVTHDAFAELACISVTVASMISIVGRNYGSSRAVAILTAGACGPIFFGLLSLGDFYMSVLAALMIPLVITTWQMAKGVREFLYRNVIAATEIATIADRFDTALNNMTHGLFMLDAQGRVLVANRRATDLLNLDWTAGLKDSHLEVVLKYGMRHSFLDGDQVRQVLRQLAPLLEGLETRTLVPFPDDFYLEFSASRRPDGGTVLIFEDVSARILAERKILNMVRYDALTGLPTRAYFSELVEATIGQGDPDRPVGFLIMDVVDFKHVNDMRGHIVGDQVLVVVAERLRALAGEGAAVGRLMGDEFVVLFADETDRAALDGRMRSLHQQMRGTYTVNGFTFLLTMSAGSVMTAAGTFSFEDVQIKADLALFESKNRNRGGFTAFEETMDEQYVDRQKLKADFQQALEASALAVVYQPMMTPDGLRIECCEALARWTHPERGPVGPAVFIRVAEEMGLVGDVTAFVLRRACTDCLDWPDEMAVSVNLSVADLRNPGFAAKVVQILEETGLPARRLHLEVTEGGFIEDPVKVGTMLQELRARGVSIAIDDFGTGYSSLSYLDTLPLDLVKVDRSFVRNIREDARRFNLLRGVVQLSRELGLRVIVEGVETADQLDLLRSHHCADLIQGYVFARPMPASEVLKLAFVAESKRAIAARKSAPA
ncbi:diguanylate cyclase/phosphodiesterase [Rhizobium sp. RU20A]|uniref:putative bifunctional diguanylate cyclase/phosphodiesterase n=1 Tax=Rhizobium sp. RU20A TaxID=1907412 RepID=UPI000953A7AC|nr:EAL domain-containing protein [Rhizobium sp. RU20A]SIR01009.1 diguanylate cyclase/phosphodiesterase [Rhizobium sp. RU20A]